ncbi:hypothetical protein GW793_01930 [bacterium]|uniref:Uncharacterized protein n=1 Tax=candidate division WWE3 bacterium CG_4_9_14_3_um_filter_39_7 TaxID=1975080 RepID=A0A2M7WZM0_UNCKA|nr:hypothetical protein [bacterium]PJA39057.1 MAG: hypothetical protein CO179_05975 [candidate division WWE3 bacterium CG_4_9_14_3_um_filter_39_7]
MELDIQKYKTQLEEMLAEVNGQLERSSKNEDSANEFRDIDNNPEDDYSESEEGFRAGELEEDKMMKRQFIMDALQRIEEGNYGKDIDSGEMISPERLDAVPYATHTLEHEKSLDEK